MTGMMMVENDTIPIQRIISVACRNYMAFDGLHTFNFDKGVNTIIGGNSSGKTSLVRVVAQALSESTSNPWGGKWHPTYSTEECLIEMRFIADDKEHYLRRVMLGDVTTDIHLYVGKGEERDFYRDGGAIEYFRKLKPITTIDGFESSRKDFYFWTSGGTVNVNPLFSKSKGHIALINRFLPMAKSGVRQLQVVGNDVMALQRNGELRHLSMLSGGDGKIIFVIAKIVNLMQDIENNTLSNVILIDEIDIGLDKAKLDGLYGVIEELANDYDCQFMITSRFTSGRPNPIRANSAKIPRCYVDESNTNLQQLIKNYVNSRPSSLIFKSPPYNVKTITKTKFKKGSFKWNP
jgi:energy-coupling factor transporter ATP-binding protein EcfA2